MIQDLDWSSHGHGIGVLVAAADNREGGFYVKAMGGLTVTPNASTAMSAAISIGVNPATVVVSRSQVETLPAVSGIGQGLGFARAIVSLL